MRNKGWGLFNIQLKKRLFIYLDKIKKKLVKLTWVSVS